MDADTALAAVIIVMRERLAVEEPWRADAACVGMDTTWFYPERGEASGPHARFAVEVCRLCPVRDECLAVESERSLWEQRGIWGGESERSRRRVRTVAA